MTLLLMTGPAGGAGGPFGELFLVSKASWPTLANEGTGYAYTPPHSFAYASGELFLVGKTAFNIGIEGSAYHLTPPATYSYSAGERWLEPYELTYFHLYPTDIVYPPTGTAAAVGFAPTLEWQGTIPVPLGTATSVGLAPTVVNGTTIQVPLGTASAVGLAPHANFTDAVPLGTATAVGLQPSVNAGGDITPSTGTATAVGFPPTVNHAFIGADSGVGTDTISVLAIVVLTDTGTGADHMKSILRTGPAWSLNAVPIGEDIASDIVYAG